MTERLPKKRKSRQDALNVKYAVVFLKRIKANTEAKSVVVFVMNIMQNALVAEIKYMRRKENLRQSGTAER